MVRVGQTGNNDGLPRPTIVTRSDARALGRAWFYTGKPCRRGHLAMRYVSSGNCCGCMALRSTAGTLAGADTRRLSKTLKLRYAQNASAEQRAAFALYLGQCVGTFNAHAGAVIVNIEKV